jgi:protein O-GlcNAc transferase
VLGSGLALRNQICFPLLAFFLSAFSMFAQSTTSAPPKPDSPTRAKPDSAEAYYTLGSVLKQQGKLPEAAAALREAIRLQPEFAGAHTTLAGVLRQSGDTAGAAAESRAGSKLARQKTSEQAAVFATNSGRRLRKAGDLDGAISQFRAARATILDYAPAHFELGLALQQRGKKDEARQEFQRANELDAHFLASADKY